MGASEVDLDELIATANELSLLGTDVVSHYGPYSNAAAGFGHHELIETFAHVVGERDEDERALSGSIVELGNELRRHAERYEQADRFLGNLFGFGGS